MSHVDTLTIKYMKYIIVVKNVRNVIYVDQENTCNPNLMYTFICHSGRKRAKNTVKYIQGHAAVTSFAHSGKHQS